MSISADELAEFEGMSDADLTKVIRDSLAAFRAKRAEAEDDIPGADPSAAAHGAGSRSTLENGASRGANRNPGATDSAQRAAIERTQAAARQMHEASIAQDARDAEAATIIPGYRRL